MSYWCIGTNKLWGILNKTNLFFKKPYTERDFEAQVSWVKVKVTWQKAERKGKGLSDCISCTFSLLCSYVQSKKALKSVLQKCTYLPGLEPLLYDAPSNILKHVLCQFSKVSE